LRSPYKKGQAGSHIASFINLDNLGQSWENARESLRDDLLQFAASVNQYLTVSHDQEGGQRASSLRGALLGQLSGTFAEQPTGLGPESDGLLYFVTDYGSLVRWDGSSGVWRLAPGTVAPSQIVFFAAAPPASAGFVLCDGSSTSYLVVDGPTLFSTNITLPNLTTGAYLEGGAAWTGAVVAASAAGLTGSTASGTSGAGGDHDHGGVTGAEASHTHGVNITSGIDAPQGSATVAPGPTAVCLVNHTHNVSGTSAAGSSHDHTISASGTHTHSVPALGAGTLAVDATGKPKHLVMLPYFKR
jgi:hypothetical protein